MRRGSRVEHRRKTKFRRRATLVLAAVTALGAGLGAGLLFDRTNGGGPEPEPSESASAVVVPLQVRMLAVSSTFAGQPVLSTAPLLIASPVSGDEPARVLVADPNLRVVGPAGDVPLREHAAGFGADGLTGAVRNELGLRIDEVATATEQELVTFLENFGDIAVSIEHRIKERGEIVYEQGVHRMRASELVTFLAFPFDDSSIDVLTRETLVGAAWEAIAGLPGLVANVNRSTLPVATRDAIVAMAGSPTVIALAATDTERGPVVDEDGYESQARVLQGAWPELIHPADRPEVELRGRSFVRSLLLLVADGIRVGEVRQERRSSWVIETEDEELGRRIARLLGRGKLVQPGDPLPAGVDARVTLGVRA